MNDVDNSLVGKTIILIRRSNNCIPIQESLPEKIDLLSIQIIFSIIYSIIWIIALTGNVFVLYIVIVKQVFF